MPLSSMLFLISRPRTLFLIQNCFLSLLLAARRGENDLTGTVFPYFFGPRAHASVNTPASQGEGPQGTAQENSTADDEHYMYVTQAVPVIKIGSTQDEVYYSLEKFMATSMAEGCAAQREGREFLILRIFIDKASMDLLKTDQRKFFVKVEVGKKNKHIQIDSDAKDKKHGFDRVLEVGSKGVDRVGITVYPEGGNAVLNFDIFAKKGFIVRGKANIDVGNGDEGVSLSHTLCEGKDHDDRKTCWILFSKELNDDGSGMGLSSWSWG
eukprot:TRINITY_DN22218_c0_g1_i1.p1 TRINITY_DN22218_c0_g1~~TRINITY_DN22218_c0_g1_i1.p1  ORF type:complete len:267 (-),score=17.89 TRINITY_DN22218_c0_g1_i1:253-1053(-)